VVREKEEQIHSRNLLGLSKSIDRHREARQEVAPRNFMGVVMEEQNNFYKIRTSNGVLPHLYSWNQLEPCSSNFLPVNQVPENTTSLHSTVEANSVHGITQGHIHCNCNGNCTTKHMDTRKPVVNATVDAIRTVLVRTCDL
jgi:hypothetical protein